VLGTFLYPSSSLPGSVAHTGMAGVGGQCPQADGLFQNLFWDIKAVSPSALETIPHLAKSRVVLEALCGLLRGGGLGTVTGVGDILEQGTQSTSLLSPHSLTPWSLWSRAGQCGGWRAHSHEHPPQGTLKIKLTFFPFSLLCQHIKWCCTNLSFCWFLHAWFLCLGF
jgi:hypothetical protein